MHDIFVGLMGRRSSESGERRYLRNSNINLFLHFFMLIKHPLHIFIVGVGGVMCVALPDNGPWRRAYPERRGISLHKCKLRWAAAPFSVGVKKPTQSFHYFENWSLHLTLIWSKEKKIYSQDWLFSRWNVLESNVGLKNVCEKQRGRKKKNLKAFLCVFVLFFSVWI